MIGESERIQGGRASNPIWRLGTVEDSGRPGKRVTVRIDGDDASNLTVAINASNGFVALGQRVLVLFAEPHGVWVQGIAGSPNTYVGAKRQRAASTSFASSTTPATMTMAAPDFEYDPFGFWAASDTILTVPEGLGGHYQVVGKVQIQNNVIGHRRIALALNGAITTWDTAGWNAGVVATRIQFVAIIELVSGDTLDVRVAQDSGVALNVSNRVIAVDLLA